MISDWCGNYSIVNRYRCWMLNNSDNDYSSLQSRMAGILISTYEVGFHFRICHSNYSNIKELHIKERFYLEIRRYFGGHQSLVFIGFGWQLSFPQLWFDSLPLWKLPRLLTFSWSFVQIFEKKSCFIRSTLRQKQNAKIEKKQSRYVFLISIVLHSLLTQSKSLNKFLTIIIPISVSLTKTRGKGRPQKTKLVEDLRAAVDEYQHIYVFSFENMRASIFKDIRLHFRESR